MSRPLGMDPISLTLLGLYVAFLLLDLVWQPRRYPRMSFWRIKGVAYFLGYMTIALNVPYLWDGLLAEHQLFDLSGLGMWAGGLVALLVLELGIYGYHRLAHASPWLWRHSHQTHHAAERVDIYGAFVFHPIDAVAFTLVSSLALVGFAGFDPGAVVVASVVATFAGFFQHANISTPAWLGYFVQRPEAHALHHARGVHAYNYADLPVIDMLFGTFRNPATIDREAGLYDGASERVVELLIGVDLLAGGDELLEGSERLEDTELLEDTQPSRPSFAGL